MIHTVATAASGTIVVRMRVAGLFGDGLDFAALQDWIARVRAWLLHEVWPALQAPARVLAAVPREAPHAPPAAPTARPWPVLLRAFGGR